jgi:heme exporter protein A
VGKGLGRRQVGEEDAHAASPESGAGPDTAVAVPAVVGSGGGGPPAVALQGVTRVFGLVPALVHVDLVIEQGEAVLLLGHNGSGKSTLLRILATAVAPTDGEGRILGWDLRKDRRQIRARVELLGHNTRLYEELTAAENLLFTCSLFGRDSRNVTSCLREAGLYRVADERVGALSQGMRQRLAMARVRLRSPELLLLDEPFAGMDSDAKEMVHDTIQEACAKGSTVVVATHDADKVSVATRSLHLERGRLLTVVPRRAAAGDSP